MTSLRSGLTLALLGAGASFLASADAHAQNSATQKPMPNVLLLVDTSGSMERMADSSLPSANAGVAVGGLQNACSPGNESNPNRWGMLVQALTGNMQPYYSCAAQDRSSGTAGAAFRNEYKIAGINPYDTDYTLPYHRPLTGTAANNTTCAIGPNKLPGAASGSSGVGPSSLGYSTAAGAGGDVRDFPSDSLQSALWTHMQTQYAANNALSSPLGINACIFNQTLDGQLDAARDYVRFALMTFDSDESAQIGVNGGSWPPAGSVQTGGGLPFLGLWSYRRDATNPLYALGTLTSGGAEGLPAGCAPPQQPFEVGARHYGAPPWEGRMVPFPAQDASLLDIRRTNEQIQQVLLTSRPFGATPIDGMMDDARDYLWYHSTGPKADPYVATANCRDQYIVLLTDGAPNLDLRPSCQGAGGNCPFPNTASQIAASLYADSTRRVTTFVIGFSVNGSSSIGGDGFPAPYNVTGKNNCKTWYAGVGGTPQQMAAACTTSPPAPGTAAEACCSLNTIAYEGSGGSSAPTSAPAVGPFFAESQADIVLAFGKILAAITKQVSTRTIPAYTPAVYASSGFNQGASTAQFLGSFIPNAQKPWSGEILRERSTCGGTPFKASPVKASIAEGDSMAVNLAVQGAANRLFITAVPDKYSSAVAVGTPATTDVVDAQRSVRPFISAPADGVPAYSATEAADKDWNLKDATNMQLALEIDRTTCRRGAKGTNTGIGTIAIPALDKDSGEACTRVVMGFTTAHVGAINETGTVPGGGTGTSDFNIRCASGGNPSAGRCSLTNATCDVSDVTSCSTIPGQTCVPTCAPLGAVFRANPVVNGPPDGLLRDAGYRTFQAKRRLRKPVLFAATTDGILHAFKAIETASSAHHELWSFIPPAVLPRLASNYPAGNQILLDGSPVVRDIVWDRAPSDLNEGAGLTPGSKWHTSLVAGLGAGGGGYYSVNVTDSDCNNAENPTTSGECATASGNTGYQAPAKGNLDQAGAADYGAGAMRGPHFMWQLTDMPKNSTNDPAKVVRRTRDGKDMVSLFGRDTGTPAMTMLQIKTSTGERQVGVAILPGGIDGQPVTGSCDRIGSTNDFAHDLTKTPRTAVRKWATNCTGADSAVPGRGVTIVRLDTGEIIRHFGRVQDTPEAISSKNTVFTAAPFDSPMVGTPVVYPQTVGAVGQKIFIGDADGTLWRIDVSSSDPAQWKAMLFADLLWDKTAAESQPIQVTPVISLEPGGALVVNAATGDQEGIVYKANEKNRVWSIKEVRPTSSAAAPRALTNWYETLDHGERVTGPMTVFDRTLYFATFAPKIPSANQCDNAGVASLWGLNYVQPESSGTGGAPMWCKNVDAAGVCTSTTLEKFEPVTGDNAGYIIPGVTLRATQACSRIDDIGEVGGGTGFETLTPSEFHLSYGVGKARKPDASGFPPAATLASSKRPLPRVATAVNAWALIVD